MPSSKTSSRQRNCNACVKSKRRCDKAQPACGRCVKQRYLCIYGGRGSVGLLDDLGPLTHPASGPSTFLPDLANTFSALPNTNIGLDSNTTFEINNDFSSLLAPMPGTSNFMAGSWPSQFIDIPAGPPEKSLTRRDYSGMVPECVRCPNKKSPMDPGIVLIRILFVRASMRRGNCQTLPRSPSSP